MSAQDDEVVAQDEAVDAAAITPGQDAGVTARLRPSLPAAATTITPRARTSAASAAMLASQSPAWDRLRLITSARRAGNRPESFGNPAA